MTLFQVLKKIAKDYGAIIKEDPMVDANGHCHLGFWLLDAETWEGIWPDGNFSSSFEELERNIFELIKERTETQEQDNAE